MAFIPATNTALVELVFSWEGQVVENTLYFEGTGAWTTTTLLALGAEAIDWWNTRLKQHTSPSVSLTSVKVTDLTSQTASSVENTTGLPIAGTSPAVEPLPTACSVVTTFKTLQRGRSYRGRNYFVGLMQDYLADENYVTTAFASAVQGAYEFISTDFTENGAKHVVVSRYHNNAPRVNAVMTDITAYVTDTRVDIQRRRMPGVGS